MLDFLAEVAAHIPDPHEKTALFYGWYSNRTRGFRRARGLLNPAEVSPAPPMDAERAPGVVRRSWARLIRKVYEADPLACPKCGSVMKVIAFIEQEDTIYRILAHLGLLGAGDVSRAPPPGAERCPATARAGPSASPARVVPREWTYAPLFDDPVLGDPAS